MLTLWPRQCATYLSLTVSQQVVRAIPATFAQIYYCSTSTSTPDKVNVSVHSATRSSKLPFSPAVIGLAKHTPPALPNQYDNDWFLRILLRCMLSKPVLTQVEPDLQRFGHDVANTIHDLHFQCESEPPWLQQYDAWGNRIDYIHTSAAWKSQKSISAREGLIAIAYKQEQNEFSRIYQTAKMYLYAPSSGLYSCPLAMTDGAAYAIKQMGLCESLQHAYTRLTSTNDNEFWTSGQWMTEKAGGSDVGNATETVAIQQADGRYFLYGYKWFSSATDSDMALTLARIANRDGETQPGSKGLSMFYLETRNMEEKLNNIQVIKMKEKLGTRQLPTAELLLYGTPAALMSEPGRGISAISHMLTISRIHNSIAASAAMRRICSWAKEYSKLRRSFGKEIRHHPLHMKTLAWMEIETMAATALTFELARLLGLIDCNIGSDRDRLLLRILTPIAKLYTAKKAMTIISEGLECIGGQGYIEETGLPSILRDGQVLPIWEGTTSILSLDVLRAIQKTDGEVINAYLSVCEENLAKADICSAVRKLTEACTWLSKAMYTLPREGINMELAARDLAFSMAAVYIGTVFAKLLSQQPYEILLKTAFHRWCEQDLLPIKTGLLQNRYTDTAAELDWNLVMNDKN